MSEQTVSNRSYKTQSKITNTLYGNYKRKRVRAT